MASSPSEKLDVDVDGVSETTHVTLTQTLGVLHVCIMCWLQKPQHDMTLMPITSVCKGLTTAVKLPSCTLNIYPCLKHLNTAATFKRPFTILLLREKQRTNLNHLIWVMYLNIGTRGTDWQDCCQRHRSKLKPEHRTADSFYKEWKLYLQSQSSSS